MSNIVISYRRSSSDAIAGRIRDKLAAHYGDKSVFMDVDDIPYGIDFREHIDGVLKEGDIVAAIVGPKWLGQRKGRPARIMDLADPVRVEIETALRRKIAVVPILVDGASMPKPEELPDAIQQFAYHNAATVDAGRDFHQHMDRLIRSMDQLVGPRTAAEPAPIPQPVRPAKRRMAWAAATAAAAAVLVAGVLQFQPGLFDRFSGPVKVTTRAVEPAGLPRTASSPDSGRSTASMAANLGKRVALVIGNADYRSVPALPKTAADALAVSDLLRALDFSVITRTNIGLREFGNALLAFADEAAKAEIAAIYYAGHAIEMSGVNYLLPVDVSAKDDRELIAGAITLDRIHSSVEGAKNLTLILLDACRNNPFAPPAAGTRSVALASEQPTRGLAANALKHVDHGLQNTLVVYAAKAGSVALDGDGVNSPFATALLNHLGTPGVDIRILLGRVRDEVVRITNGRQEPFVYGSLGGDVVALARPK